MASTRILRAPGGEIISSGFLIFPRHLVKGNFCASSQCLLKIHAVTAPPPVSREMIRAKRTGSLVCALHYKNIFENERQLRSIGELWTR